MMLEISENAIEIDCKARQEAAVYCRAPPPGCSMVGKVNFYDDKSQKTGKVPAPDRKKKKKKKKGRKKNENTDEQAFQLKVL